MFCETDDQVRDLLNGFLAKDTELQNLAIKREKALLAAGRTAIQNGFNITLTTGTMYLYPGDETKTFSMEPEMRLTFPALRNLALSLNVPLTFGNEGSIGENARVEASLPLISTVGKKRRLTLLRAERAVFEAEQAFTRRALQAEKEFYAALQDLYNLKISLLTHESAAYDKDIDLLTLQAQGYGASSARLRTGRLEAEDAHRAVREDERLFERRLATFARNCGIAVTELPQALPEAELSAVTWPEQTRESEAAEWAHYVGELDRAATSNRFPELSAQGSFTYKAKNMDGKNSIGAGLSFSWYGVTLSAGAEFAQKPALTFGIGINLEDLRLHGYDAALGALDAKAELLAIDAAKDSDDETRLSRETEARDLAWEKLQRAEQLALYEQLYREMRPWFESGNITESEWRKTETDAAKARYQSLLTEIKMLVYIIEGKLL
jgi:hypothetical protein